MPKIATNHTELTSETIKRYQSLQEDIGKVTFNSVNESYSSKYASLPYLLQTVMPTVHKHGFIITVTATSETGIVTTLVDVNGELVVSFDMPWPETRDPQKLGSAITYARRYGLCAVLNLCVDKDDDGNAASGKSAAASVPRGFDKNSSHGFGSSRPAEDENILPPKSKGLHKTSTKGNRSTKKRGEQYKLPLDSEIPF